jgi:uncharacterized Zn finger protein (UPF0148 family)
MLDEPPPHPLTHPCPACGQPVEIPAEITGAPVQCPACGEQFIIDDEAPEPEVEAAQTSEDELDARRIERISKLRRSIYRSRSHAIIATAVCAVGAIQLIILLAREARDSLLNWRSALYLILLVPAVVGIRFFAKSALALHRQAKTDHPTG